MHEWKTAPTHTITGLQELYQQLLPTKLYLAKKVKMLNSHAYNCRMCGKETESVAHVLALCGAIVQSEYVERHNNVLRILFFEIFEGLHVIDETKRITPLHSKHTPLLTNKPGSDAKFATRKKEIR